MLLFVRSKILKCALCELLSAYEIVALEFRGFIISQSIDFYVSVTALLLRKTKIQWYK